MKRIIFSLLTAMLAVCCWAQASSDATQWTASWATATEFTGPGDMPKVSLSNRSIRMIVHVSLGGKQLRLKLSNAFSKEAVDIKSVYVADATTGWEIAPKTAKYLTFGGKKSTTMEGGTTLESDVFTYNLKPLQRLAVTINYGDRTPVNATSHRGSRTTSYIIDGVSKPKSSFENAETLEHWYNIDALDVMTEKGVPCVVALGNSITDGRGTTTNEQNRWTDFMAEALDGKVGVLNLGIGGTCLALGNSQATGHVRFDRDVLGQSGVTGVIIFYGVNDIGGSKGHYDEIVNTLTQTMSDLTAKAHAKGLKVYLGTITPFGRSFYASIWHETMRQVVNAWIRNYKEADGIIDFDAMVRNPAHPDELQEVYSSDWLHLGPKGYEVIGKGAAKIFE